MAYRNIITVSLLAKVAIRFSPLIFFLNEKEKGVLLPLFSKDTLFTKHVKWLKQF